MSSTAIVLGTDRCPYEAYMQIAGTSGLWISAAVLQQAMIASPTLHGVLLRYVQTMMVQSASSTTAAAANMIEQRLARWLLMCHDRVRGDEMYLTQEFMAMMLGSRRPSVTLALHILEGQHLIVSKRHNLIIRDRVGLERLASASYGFAEAEYERLMGISLAQNASRANRREIMA